MASVGQPVNVMFARFPFPAQEHPDCLDWMVPTIMQAREDPRIKNIRPIRFDDTPITMTRNKCIEAAKAHEIDFLVMLDSDMLPDAYLPSNAYKLGADPSAVPFFESSFDFAYRHRYEAGGPCLVAAPYCGRPPVENVFIFRWTTNESNNPNPDMALEAYSREEATRLVGFERVAALPTGLIIIDMDAIERLVPPYFYYEWTDVTESEKASTEDVTFTRDLSLAGVPIYCNWNSWAGHWKPKCVGRPRLMTSDTVSEKFRQAMNTPPVHQAVPRDELQLIGQAPVQHGNGAGAKQAVPAGNRELYAGKDEEGRLASRVPYNPFNVKHQNPAVQALREQQEREENRPNDDPAA